MNKKLFFHPEFQRKKTRILPIFLPFLGCKTRCIYCDQRIQTGGNEKRLPVMYSRLKKQLEKIPEHSPLELGFFGGTFTNLPAEWRERFLSLARQYKAKGRLTRIRCSTRPDAVTPDMLISMKRSGLDCMELGIQSFDSKTLAASCRGYGHKQAYTACRLVKNSGLSLGIQLLPGLPRHTPKTWSEDAKHVVNLQPSFLRIYPCLVLKNTALAAMWKEKQFFPWTMEKTVECISSSLLSFWKEKIAVIRIGLAPEPEMIKNILAGPWHPALGAIIKSQALHGYLHEHIRTLSSAPRQLTVPHRYLSDVIGHKKTGIAALQKMGLNKNSICTWSRDYFVVKF